MNHSNPVSSCARRWWRWPLAAGLLSAAVGAQAALVGLYPFEGNADDLSGNARHAILINATPTPDGYEGQAYSFDGQTQQIRLPINISPNVMQKVTFGCWVWLEALRHGQTVLSQDNGNYGRTINVDSRGSPYPSFSIFRGGGVIGSGELSYRRWVFFAGRYDHSTGLVVLNVDGLQYLGSPYFPPNGKTTLEVGDNPGFPGPGSRTQGKVDNVFVFDEFLSDQQIETIRTGGVAGVQAVAAGADGSVDLQATLTMPAQVRTNDLFNAQVRVRNLGGPSSAVAASVHTTLPDAANADLAALPEGCWQFDRELYCSVGTVGPGAQKILKIPLIARKAGALPLAVNLSTQSFDTDAANDVSSAQSTVSNTATASGVTAPVPVANASFEQPALTDGTWTFDNGADWGVPLWTNPVDYGVQNPLPTEITNGEPADGIMQLWSNRDSPAITQVLPSVLTRGLKYTLRVAVGRRLDASYGGYRIELWAGGVLLASQQNIANPVAGSYTDAKLVYTLRSRHPMEGQPLEVRIMRGGLGGVQTVFDNVRLSVTAAPPKN